MISIRPVCFIDILGFKTMTDQMSLQNLSNLYTDFLKIAQFYMIPPPESYLLPRLFPNHPPEEPFCISHVFSDSFIFIAKDSDVDSCLELLVYSWRILQASFALGLPLRGGITCNEVYVNKGSGVYMGRALVEAYNLEQEQEWIGVSVDRSVERCYPALFQPICSTTIDVLFPQYMVPVKHNDKRRMRVLNWRYNLIAEHGTRSLFRAENDPRVMKKVENTLEFANAIVRGGKIYTTDQSKCPAELRAFYIGKSEPPFRHGDNL